MSRIHKFFDILIFPDSGISLKFTLTLEEMQNTPPNPSKKIRMTEVYDVCEIVPQRNQKPFYAKCFK